MRLPSAEMTAGKSWYTTPLTCTRHRPFDGRPPHFLQARSTFAVPSLSKPYVALFSTGVSKVGISLPAKSFTSPGSYARMMSPYRGFGFRAAALKMGALPFVFTYVPRVERNTSKAADVFSSGDSALPRLSLAVKSPPRESVSVASNESSRVAHDLESSVQHSGKHSRTCVAFRQSTFSYDCKSLRCQRLLLLLRSRLSALRIFSGMKLFTNDKMESPKALIADDANALIDSTSISSSCVAAPILNKSTVTLSLAACSHPSPMQASTERLFTEMTASRASAAPLIAFIVLEVPSFSAFRSISSASFARLRASCANLSAPLAVSANPLTAFLA